MKKLLFLIILASCSTNTVDNGKNIIFSESLTFDSFKNLLEIYAKESSYPDID
jgi:hypothetical protein